MVNKNKKNLFWFFLGYLAFSSFNVYGQCISKDCQKLDSYTLDTKKKNNIFLKSKIDKSFNKISFINNPQYNILEEDAGNLLNNILSNILASNTNTQEGNNEKFNYEIESDSQYFDGDVFFAEGNVKLFLENGLLEDDTISYVKRNKLFK